MAKGASFDNQFLKLIFQAVGIANLADNAASAPATNLYVSLHTADPTSSGNQASSEATYTPYARAAVPRSSGTPGWSVSSNSVSPTQTIQFPACTAGSNNITNFAVGLAASGAGEILYSGTVSPAINVQAGVTAQLTIASTITEN